MAPIQKARSIVKKIFGFDDFISLQEEIIANILAGRDTLVVMPTGGGKSLCYQVPALIFEGLTIVVSPLISLMKDQLTQLKQVGIQASVLNSSLLPDQYRRNVEKITSGQAKLLYLAPERLLQPGMLALLSNMRVDCLAIDEAHCISEWGHDFRPEYRRMAEVRCQFPQAVCLASTATATKRVREDIKQCLGFSSSGEFVAGFDRSNLMIRVVPKERPMEQTLALIRRYPEQAGIVYCATRRQVDDLAAYLADEGILARAYHAGLDETLRTRHQEMFTRDDIQVVVATIAFGMGINKSNIRFVIHFDLPRNIEGYYQEIGRAGRDGLPSECVLLFSPADIYKIKFIIDQKADNEKRIAGIHLNAILDYAQSDVCRRIPLLKYFGEEYPNTSCGMCDICLSDETDGEDVTVAAQMFLSCVKRTGERFGAVHVIDVLRGSKGKRVIQFGHQHLSTYGIGMEYSKKQWQQLARLLVHKGFLVQDMQYGGLSLAPKAWDVLKGKTRLMGRLKAEVIEPVGKQEVQDYDGELFALLRSKRKALADEAGIAPYIIFSDKTLTEMAAHFPKSPQSLLSIHGVGKTRLENYGKDFLSIIADYCKRRKIAEIPKQAPMKAAKSTKSAGPRRHEMIAKRFNEGATIESIMDAYKVKMATVLNHLERCHGDGMALNSEGLKRSSSLPHERRELVLKAFGRLGHTYLKPVHQAFNGEIDWDELKICRLLFLSREEE
jgi:ATP-dependent DNA helicase RecQ